MSLPPSSPGHDFAGIDQQWDLERLYGDLEQIKQRELSDTEKTCLKGLLCGLSTTDIATIIPCSLKGLRVELSRGLYRYIEQVAHEPVRHWATVTSLMERAGYRKSSIAPDANPLPPSETLLRSNYDWGEAPEVAVFFGRTQELDLLTQWIVDERCRLVSILGMGGMGKTRLSVRLGAGGIGKTDLSLTLARGIQDQFEYVIWRSLLNAPAINGLLADWIKILSNQQETQLPDDLEGRLSRLMYYLRNHRCLLILDNVETIFQGKRLAGDYRDGYTGYGQLLQTIGETSHQSCLLLTSREKPREVARIEGKNRSVRSMQLSGLDAINGKRIFAELGTFMGTDAEWQTLVELYDGNPLALELAAKHIDEVFLGDISEFLANNNPIFHDLRELLDWHFDRLSPQEQEIAYWFAINREPTTVAELKEDILSSTAHAQVAETLQLLQRRLPLERSSNGFTLQPVLIEHITDRLINQVCEEIIQSEPITLLDSHALLKATAKEYVRENQRRLILHPILEQAITRLENQENLEQRLQGLLNQLRDHGRLRSGYAGGNLLNLLCQLQADLSGYDFSHLMILQAYLQGMNVQGANFTSAQFAKSVFTQTFGGVLSVAFSPDGTYVATGDTNGDIHLWDAKSGKKRMGCKGHTSWVWSIAFSPNNQWLASASDDGLIKLWEVRTGKCLQVLENHTAAANTVVFSPDGTLLASSGQDATVQLWRIQPAAQELLQHWKVLCRTEQRIWAIAFSPDGQTLAGGSEDHHLYLWDLNTGDCLQTLHGHTDWIRSVAFSPDGQFLASGSTDSTIRLWEVGSDQCYRVLQGHTQEVTKVTFSADGRYLATCSHDQTLRLWDMALTDPAEPTGQCRKTLQGHTNRLWSVAFSPNGQHLVSGGDDHATKLWSVKTGQCVKTWKGHTNEVLCLALNPLHSLIATGHEDETVKLWDMATGQVIRTLHGHHDRIWALTFVPQASLRAIGLDEAEDILLVSGSGDSTLKVWNCRTGQCLRTLEGHTSWIWYAVFSPDGQHLVSSSYDATLKLWQFQTGECLRTLEGHQSSAITAVFSPDGTQFASSSFDTTIKRWDLTTGECIQTLEGHENTVWQTAFSPDGKQLLSCSYDQTIKQWDIATGDCLATLREHTAPVVVLDISPNGRYLVSGGLDCNIKLWDLQTGTCLRTFYGHQGTVSSLCFTPEAKWIGDFSPAVDVNPSDPPRFLISSSFDETIKVWEVATGQCLHTLRTPRPYEGMDITHASGLTEAEKATLYALGAIERSEL
ncbi:NB-ARC domain-containing protein [Egbenema bharatensis]|uniref:NB-ARC domain-containing protein n=1 Tax=Egbenema bharatensis TaxID=3463334 RepID=UPI003A8495FF